MRRLLSPFLAALTLVVAGVYAYLAWRIAGSTPARLLLAIPFVLIWIVPAVYWVMNREKHGPLDDAVHAASYVSMGWLNFAMLLSLLRDALLLAGSLLHAPGLAVAATPAAVWLGSFLMLGLGMLWALRGPAVRRVRIVFPQLPAALAGLRIVQITDVHVGPTIGLRYVRRIVDVARTLGADFYALTGDFVDGPVRRLAPQLEPLRELAAERPAFFVTGNHEYYVGVQGWIEHFRTLGIQVLQNEHARVERNGAALLVAGVNDPAARRIDSTPAPDPEKALHGAPAAALRVLLAHNPKIAPRAAAAGFDLQLSGHTHAGQFFPWTLAVRRVHAPHVVGLSREGRMQVYVSPGTGSWGPPVRFGTRTEITLIELASA
ncbi:MAG TPA: metallophosphoesterase [Candidatus Binatia bacterium]|nr:metallophosphoesterase [Candidatus Binatia bacterium]